MARRPVLLSAIAPMNVVGLHLQWRWRPRGLLLERHHSHVTIEAQLGERLRQRRDDRRWAIDLSFGIDQLLGAVLLADPPAAVRPAVENACRQGHASRVGYAQHFAKPRVPFRAEHLGFVGQWPPAGVDRLHVHDAADALLLHRGDVAGHAFRVAVTAEEPPVDPRLGLVGRSGERVGQVILGRQVLFRGPGERTRQQAGQDRSQFHRCHVSLPCNSGSYSFARRRQRQVQPRQSHVTPHVALAIAAGGVVEHGQAITHLHHRGQADALAAPGAVLAVQHHRLVVGIPAVQILGPVDPDRIGVLVAFQADVVREQEPGLVSRLEVERAVLDLLLRRHDRRRIDRPGAIEIAGAGDADGPFHRGAEEHQILVALPDDLAGAGRVLVVRAGLGSKRNHLRLLDPRPGWRAALGLHRQIGEGGDQIRRGRGVRRAEIEHVPDLAVEVRHAVGRRGGILLALGAEIEHGTLGRPIQQVLAGRQAAQPALGSSPVVVHVVGAVALVDPDVACAQVVAPAGAGSVPKDDPLILRLQPVSGAWAVVRVLHDLRRRRHSRAGFRRRPPSSRMRLPSPGRH